MTKTSQTYNWFEIRFIPTFFQSKFSITWHLQAQAISRHTQSWYASGGENDITMIIALNEKKNNLSHKKWAPRHTVIIMKWSILKPLKYLFDW